MKNKKKPIATRSLYKFKFETHTHPHIHLCGFLLKATISRIYIHRKISKHLFHQHVNKLQVSFDLH